MICSWSARAQEFPALKFNQLTVKDGLSTNAIRSVYIARNGIVWIATSKGLNKYDGTGVTVYHHDDDDSTSIANDALESITEDRDNTLWLGSLNGLSHFNPETGKSVNYFHQPGNRNTLASNEKCYPLIDSKGTLWIATWAGVQRFNRKTKQFITYAAPALNVPDPDHYHNTFTIVKEDRKHRIWALSAFGLYLVNEKSHQLEFYSQHNASLNTAFYQAANGAIYVGTKGGGLRVFDFQSRKFECIMPNLFNEHDTKINDLIEWTDNQNKSWLCIGAAGGLILKDVKSNRYKEYRFDHLNPSSLKGFTIYHIAKDKQNRLWLSTDEGINIIDPFLQNFENLPLYQQSGFMNPKLFGLPNNMLETEDMFYLTGYFAKGVYLYDKEWNLKEHLEKVPPGAKSELSKSVNSIYKDEKGSLWFSTDSGLIRKKINKYDSYFLPDVDLSNKSNLAISKIYKRKDGLFWLRARGNGIYIFDPLKGKFLKNYKPDGKKIDGVVYACYLDQDDILWVGATRGISYYLPKQDCFKKVIVRNSSGKEVNVTWVTDLTQDSDNTVWAVSDVGLVKINKASGTGLLINNKMGLPENYLKRILVDSLGNLWIPSQQGIIKYDRKKKFTFFNINNGLPFQYEGHGFFEKDSKGNFLLGFSGFVTRFNPYQVKTNTMMPEVVLVSVSADGQRQQVEGKDRKKTISFSPGTKIINIHFTISNYTAPQQNSYFYRLGNDAHWQRVKNGDIALAGLPEGDYKLSIKGSNNDNVFSREEKLYITVMPHWYETLLFKIITGLTVIAIVTLLVRKRIDFIRSESSFRQKLVESELTAIRAQMNPHFIFNVLNSIESFIVDHDAKQASLMVQKFASLCRLVLENSTQSLVSAEREWKAIQLYTELEAVRFSNQFAFDFSYDEHIDMAKLTVPPMLFQPLIENAIHHGLRNYPQADGVVKVTLTQNDNLLCFTVSDNGIGLGKARRQKVNNMLKQKSLAIKGIEDRIQAINALTLAANASFEIKEIIQEGKSGTIAVLNLPLTYLNEL
ncbi:two-component regulator propeller domain-containing protein [Pedobacter sp. BMA]|uniref:ligand-binding sensor domain-containing protein n=1 Tax=Pedobacter sp. BMA TaxID=1663685 RepID=UPI00064AC456|nr:two-component regulator propeller domain-containing protein [Pedobacter sp. BMA]KLT66677.1 hypothetical protein AB669_05780 [Pedobacter sp. BMA]